MKYIYQLAVVLTAVTLVRSQYGPLKGPATRRTTTPFPPGFQSDNEIYNSIDSGTFSQKGTGGGSPGFGGSQTGGFSASSGSSSGNVPSGNFAVPVSGHGSLSGSHTKPGAATNVDNPWLSGIVSGSSKPSSPSGNVVNCNAPGFACVPKHQCQGGQTSSPGSGVSK